MKTLLVLFTILAFAFAGAAQKQNNNWCFGEHVGLDFNSGSPLVFQSQINISETGASVSDRLTGDLLFYTDGFKIWDKNHAIMPNSYGIGTDTPNYSCAQGAVIVPVPASTGQYYVFTLEDVTKKGKLRYSKVDMQLNNGNGDVVTGEKAILLDSNLSEAMAVVKGTPCSYWLLVNYRDSGLFAAYKINAAGVKPVPKLSYFAPEDESTGCHIRFSNNGKTMVHLRRNGGLNLYDFDKITGALSHRRVIDTIKGWVYSAELSPDNTLLYAGTDTDPAQIYQYDLQQPGAAAIKGSRQLVGKVTTSAGILGTLQLAPDGNIYVSQSGYSLYSSLHRISNPNQKWPGCTWTQNAVQLSPGTAMLTLPQAVLFNDDITNNSSSLINCTNEAVTLSAPESMLGYQWQDGSTDSVFTALQPGSYWVKTFNGCNYQTDTFHLISAQVRLPADTTICAGDKIVLALSMPGASYAWSDGSNGNTIEINSAGKYYVSATLGNCITSDTIEINVRDVALDLGGDTVICPGNSILIGTAAAYDTYTWNDGYEGPSRDIDKAGSYHLRVVLGGCKATDSIRIQMIETTVDLGGDRILCKGEELTLTVPLENQLRYLWQDGSGANSITARNTEKYWVTITNLCGSFSDTVDLVFESCDCNVFVPSAFTPNGDGLNDEMTALLDCTASDYKFLIMNRFGEIVFQAYSAGKRWNGIHYTKPAEMGTYFYLLQFTGPRGQKILKKGDIVLVR